MEHSHSKNCKRDVDAGNGCFARELSVEDRPAEARVSGG